LKVKLHKTITGFGEKARTIRGIAFLTCFVLFAAAVALIVSLADKQQTDTAKPQVSQKTLDAGSFTISNPSLIQNSGGVLQLVDLGGGTYSTDAPYVTSTNPISYVNLGGFTQTLGENNEGQVTYRLSPDGDTWYWWNGSTWVTITASNTIYDANTAAELNDHLDEFAAQFGGGNLYIRAYFRSNGTQRVELQKITLTVYTLPAPVITDVDPAVGPVSGGINVTITGNNFTPELTPYDTTTNSWTHVGTTTSTANHRSLAVIGDKVYLFGGSGPFTNRIYSAPVSDPTNMTNTGKTLPNFQCCTQIAVIGDYVYMFGGGYTSGIWRAPVSDPTTWSTTGASMPIGGEGAGLYMVDDTMYYITAQGLIYAASTADPLTWTNTGKTTPGAQRYPLIVKIGSAIYLYAGNKIFTASTANPATWTDTGKTLPGTISTSSTGSSLGVVGDKLYIYTGSSIYSASLSDPTTWTNTGITLPFNATNAAWALIGDKMYLYAGADIYSAPVTGDKPNIYNLPWITDRPTVVLGIEFGGVPATNVQAISSTTAIATVPAHAAGFVDVKVISYDGQIATLENGFEYLPPPSVSSATPSSGSIAGGDTVTIIGDNFREGATVKFGEFDAASVTYVNSSTLIAVTPPHTIGEKSITVTNPDGEKARLSAGFTYITPAPDITSITPDQGPVSGGLEVTINGSGFIPPNSTTNTWSNVAASGLPAITAFQTAVIDDKAYIFGGSGSAAIYSAPVSNPTNWTYTGKSLPGTIANSNLEVIGDTIYMFGGQLNGAVTDNIFAAPITDPTNWTNLTATNPAARLPQPRMAGGVRIIHDTVYYFAGGNGATTTNTIFSAPVSDPTNWTNVTAESGGTLHLPGSIQGFQMVMNKERIYALGGLTTNAANSSSATIFSAPVSDPTNWTNTGKTLPTQLSLAEVRVVNDTVYLLGGTTMFSQNNIVYAANISDPTTWTNTGKSLPSGRYSMRALTIGDSIYLFGGTGTGIGANAVVRTSVTQTRPNVYDNPWTTTWSTMPLQADFYSATFNNVPATNVTYVSPTELKATIPPHAAGFVDVTVGSYFGQPSTLTDGFEYVAPPEIVSVTPDSGSTAGGDVVTVTGVNFQNGATVRIGGIDATSVTYVNSSTLLATVPANVAGSYDVTVINPGGQSATLANGFTYLNLPPVVSSVNPQIGPLEGGMNVTIHGSDFIPQNSISNVWTDTGGVLPGGLSLFGDNQNQVAVIGDRIYVFGGATIGTGGGGASDFIFSAPVSDPTNLTDTGKRLPSPRFRSAIAVIGDTIYMFGGRSATGGLTDTIFSAPVSDPTNWIDTGKKLPVSIYSFNVLVVGDALYIYGGNTSSRPILYAHVSDPTTWTQIGSMPYGAPEVNSAATVIGDRIYLFGGKSGLNNASTVIYSAHVSNPTVVGQIGSLPQVIQGASLLTIGDRMYLYGGGGAGSSMYNTILSAPISDPTSWTAAGTLPVAMRTSAIVVVNDMAYIIGNNVNAKIYATSISRQKPNYYNQSWITNWQTVDPSSDLSSVTFDGVPATNVTFVSSTEITATIPAHAAGFVDVVVSNYDGQTSTLSDGFEYVPSPEILSVNPNSGTSAGGDTVTIMGDNFREGATVKFGDIEAASVTFIDSNTLSVVTPVTEGGWSDVSVTNIDGQTGTLEDGFKFIRPPLTITSVNPAMGSMEGGTGVTVTGTNFSAKIKDDVASVYAGATATASRTYLTNYPDYAFDNDDNTVWVANSGTGNWVQAAFDKYYTIGRIEWVKCGSDASPRQAQIQLYQNGAWVTHYQLTNAWSSGEGDATGAITLPNGELAAGIRLYFNSASGWVRCASLRAYELHSNVSVSFGGVPAPLVSYRDSTTLYVETPPHAPGAVDVHVSDEFSEGDDTLEEGYTYLPAAYAFTNNPLNVAATEPGALTIQALDTNGDPVTSTHDITLSLATDSESGFFARDLDEDESTRWDYDSVVLPAGQSSVTFYYKDNLQGTPTITVTDPSGTQVQQQQTIGPRYKLLVTGVTDPVQVGVPSSITVQAVDYQGQPQTDYTGTVHFTSTDEGALLPADFTFTPEMLGMHTFVNGVTMRTQGEWCVTVTDTEYPSITGSQCDITVTPPNAGTISKLKIITPPQSFPADSHSSAITVQTQDIDGLPIPVANDTTIYVYSDSITGEFSVDGETGWTSGSPFEITIKAGATSANVYYRDNTAGTHTITMRDDMGTGPDFGWTNDSQQITIGVGEPTKLGVTASAAVPAGEWMPVTVHLQDSVSNDVTSLKNIQVRVTSDSGTARFSTDPSGSDPVETLDTMIAAGSATVTIYVSDTTAGQLTLTATDISPLGDPYDPGETTITVGPGDPVAIGFLPVVEPIRAGEAKQLAAYLKDIYGNVTIATDAVDVAFTSTSGGGGFNNIPAGPWVSVGHSTINAGTSTTSIYYRDVVSGNPTITASTTEFGSGQITPQVIGGPYNGKLRFKSAPPQFTAGVEQEVQVELLDDFNNPTIADNTVSITFTRSDSVTGEFSVNGTSWSTSVTTNIPAGTGDVTVLYRDTKAGSVTIQAAQTDVPIRRVSYTPSIVAAAPAKYIYTSNPQIIARNTASQPITIEIQDQYNNPASAPNGFALTINTTSATGEFSVDGSSGWTNGSLLVPFAEGASSVSVYYRDGTNGTYTLDVSGNGLTGASQNIRVVEALPNKIVLLSSGNAIAGEPIAVTLKTQSNDGIDVPVPEDTMFNLSGIGEFSLTATPWNATTSVTLNENESEITLYYRSTQAGIHTITASETPSKGWTDGTTDIVVGGAEIYRFSFTTKPSSVPVTEVSGVFTVSALDIYGNITTPSSDTTVYLYTTSGAGSFAVNAAGPWDVTSLVIPTGGSTASFYYRDMTLGTPIITASDKNPLESPDEDILNATTTIDVIGQQASKLAFTTAPQIITAGELSSAITIQLQKEDGTPAIQGSDVTFTLENAGMDDNLIYFAVPDMGSVPITQVMIPRGASSVSFYATGSKAGVKEIHPYVFNYPGVGLIHTRQDLTIEAAKPESLVFTTPPQTIHAGEASAQMKVELRDVFDNVAKAQTDITVNFASNCVAGEFSLADGGAWNTITSAIIPAGQSEIYFYFRSMSSGTCTMTLSSTDLSSAEQDIEVVYGVAVALDFISAPQTIVAGQNSDTITVSTKDIYGNVTPIDEDTTIYFSTSSPTGQFSQDSVVIPAGQSSASVTYRDMAPGTPTLYARDQDNGTDTGLIDASQGITITAGTPTKFAFVPDTFNIVAGQLQQLKIELRNEYDAPFATDTNKTIDLSTDVASGEFRASGSLNAPVITQATIPAGQSSVTVYYRQTTAAAANLSASDPDAGLSNGTAVATVFSDSLKGMQFVTSPQTLEANQPSSAMTVMAVDEFGNATEFAPTPMTLYLYSSSPSAKFYSNANMTQEITSITILGEDRQTITFYYRDAALGTATITVSDRNPLDSPDTGLKNATQTVTIVPGTPAKLGIVGGQAELERGGTDGPNYVVLRNAYDIEINTLNNQTVYLSSTSNTAEFSASANGPWQNILSVVIPAGQSRAEFYYRDDHTLGAATMIASDVAPPEVPDTGLINGTKNITVVSGPFAQLGFTTAPQTITARHPSNIMTVQALNRYGKPTTVTANTTLYLRSDSASGEFATSPSGPWGISSVIMTAGDSTVSFYYRDSREGTPTIRVSNSLSTNPSEVIAVTQQQTIERQVLSHFLVTNISDPQYQGNPSSVVVAAVDAENYVIDWYDGTITFSASDNDAILPGSYTFNPSKDKGIHTFVNSVAFMSPGEKTVTVTDTNGITGQQTGITVLGNVAGPPAKLVFITPSSPMSVTKNQASEVITVQIQDGANMPTNAGPGGFPVRLTSSSGTGEFALSPSGPWQSAATFTIPEGLSYLNLYYRDSSVGQSQITASDWTGGVDNPAITNAMLDVIVNALQINSSQQTSSRNFANNFVTNPLFFAYNEQGDVTGRASFTAEAREERDGSLRPVNWQLTWRNSAGAIIGQQTAENTANISYNPSDVTARAGDDPFTLDIQAIDPNTEEVSGATRSVVVSPWQAKAVAPSSYIAGDLLTITVESRQHQNLADAPQGVVEIVTDSLQSTGIYVPLTSAQHTDTGSYDASMISPALAVGQTYRALVRLLDPSGDILAEALSAPFQVQEHTGGGEGPDTEDDSGATGPSGPGSGSRDTQGGDSSSTGDGSGSGPTDQPTGSDDRGGGIASPNQNKSSSGGDGSDSSSALSTLMTSLGKSLKRFLQTPAAPVVISNSLFGFVIAMAVILLWQAWRELRQVRLLVAILEREKRTAEDKDNFLQLCAHYLRTPITIIASSSELLVAKMGDQYKESVQTLNKIVKSLQQKAEQLISQTAGSAELQAIVAPNIEVERRKLYTNPLFWLPVVLSIVLTLLGNWAVSAIGSQSVSASVLLEQIAIGTIAIILLYTGLRLRAMRRRRKQMLADALQRRAALDQAKNKFVKDTYDLLADDVYLLAELQSKLPSEEKFVEMLGSGTARLEKLMDKFKLFTSVDSTKINVSAFTTTQLVNQALGELSEELRRKEITVDRHGQSITMQQDAALFERVVSSVLANAAEFNNQGGVIDIETRQRKNLATVVIRDNGPGFKQDPEQLFEAFKRGDSSLDFTHEGLGLDLYLDRLIMRHLGGDIRARNIPGGGAEVELRLPVLAQ